MNKIFSAAAPVSQAFMVGICLVFVLTCDNSQTSVRKIQEVKSQAIVDYISNPAEFKSETNSDLTEFEKNAIAAAKEYLEHFYDKPLRGTFSVAVSSPGYQVNFSDLFYLQGSSNWSRVDEGFGEIWVREGRVIRADIGP